MVEYFDLDIPFGHDVENPIEDVTFMTQIGAKKICGFAYLFDLKNSLTGTRFTFGWHKYIAASYSICTLRREEKIV